MNKKLLSQKIKSWANDNSLSIAIYNISIMLIILLRSAGYFYPYFPISINTVILFALIMLIVLFRAKSSLLFFIFLAFWLFASFLKIVGIDIWAERTSLYAFESLFVATILFILESLNSKAVNDF